MPVDAEGFIEIRSLWYLAHQYLFSPSVDLEVAHCAEFVLGCGRAEPESAQLRQVWSMNWTVSISRRVDRIATLQHVVFNAYSTIIEEMVRQVSLSSQF